MLFFVRVISASIREVTHSSLFSTLYYVLSKVLTGVPELTKYKTACGHYMRRVLKFISIPKWVFNVNNHSDYLMHVC